MLIVVGSADGGRCGSTGVRHSEHVIQAVCGQGSRTGIIRRGDLAVEVIGSGGGDGLGASNHKHVEVQAELEREERRLVLYLQHSLVMRLEWLTWQMLLLHGQISAVHSPSAAPDTSK